jgi:hypothetical protein
MAAAAAMASALKNLRIAAGSEDSEKRVRETTQLSIIHLFVLQ